MNEGPIYIAGLDRSGKTTMRAFLASHPRIAIPAVGSNMWTHFYGRFGDLGRPANLDRCLDAMLTYKHVAFLRPDEARIRSEFAAGSPTYARLFALFLQHYAEGEGKPRWGAQTGLIERYADRLFDAYRGLKIVHMVRDPRDRYEASISKWPDGRGRAGGAAARWRYSSSLALRHVTRHPDAYLIVRFEDMVTETEATLRRVFEFLGEEFDPRVLAMPDADKHRETLGVGSVAVGERVLSPAYIGLHETNVDRFEVAALETLLGSRMRRFGYEPATGGPRRSPGFWLRTMPDQTARYAAWRVVEAAQMAQPRLFPRLPGERMLVPRVGGADR